MNRKNARRKMVDAHFEASTTETRNLVIQLLMKEKGCSKEEAEVYLRQDIEQQR